MTQVRIFGIVVLVLSGLLLWYTTHPLLQTAPVLLVFAIPAGILAGILGLMMVAGKA